MKAFATYSNFQGYVCETAAVTNSNLWKTNISITSNLLLIMFAKAYVLSLMIKRYYANTHQYLAFKMTKGEDAWNIIFYWCYYYIYTLLMLCCLGEGFFSIFHGYFWKKIAFMVKNGSNYRFKQIHSKQKKNIHYLMISLFLRLKFPFSKQEKS